MVSKAVYFLTMVEEMRQQNSRGNRLKHIRGLIAFWHFQRRKIENSLLLPRRVLYGVSGGGGGQRGPYPPLEGDFAHEIVRPHPAIYAYLFAHIQTF